MPRLRVALAQTNPVVGDLHGNSDLIARAAADAAELGADLVVTGEMALSGYPIEDLASRPSFLASARKALERLAARLAADGLGDVAVVVGHPDGPFEPRLTARNSPRAIAKNCASVLQHGRVRGTYAKHHLPNYAVFDEYRTFLSGDDPLILRIADANVAIIVCEDLWRDEGPVAAAREAGSGLLVVLNASPFERDKDELRLPLVTRRAREASAPVAYVNLVGGQDDLVFDGDSVIVDRAGDIIARAPQFTEHLLIADIDVASAPDAAPPTKGTHVAGTHVALESSQRPQPERESDIAVPVDEREQLWNAIVTGVRDYIDKNRFPSVVLGLSGGIDSAVCAVIAADAIGPDRVYAVGLPSQWSSDHSRSDAADLAERVGLHYSVQPIADFVAPLDEQLALGGTAAENVQARIRAVVLMGLSNMHGHLLLTTGNKSEISVGYSTIYGDSAGGFAPLKDVPKTLVWELARWRNEAAESRGETAPIPENSITKPPSAELRPDQVDEDSLPDYDVLDPLLYAYIDRALSAEEIVAEGFDAELVARIVELVDRAEWKRRQGAIGPKISAMAFGRDRRMPITYRPTRTLGT